MGTDNEHTEILLIQVAELVNILMDTFASGEIGDSDMATVAQGLERYVQQVEQIATTAGAGEWMGLYNICVLYQAALVPLVGNPEALSEPLLVLLESWPSLVMSYLEAPGSPDASAALIECLQDPAWIAPLQADEVEILKDILAEQAAGAPISADGEVYEDTVLSDDIFDTDSPMAEDMAAEAIHTEPDSLAFDHDDEETDAFAPFQSHQPTDEAAHLEDAGTQQEAEAPISEIDHEDAGIGLSEDSFDVTPPVADEVVTAEAPDESDALAFDNGFEESEGFGESGGFDMQEELPSELAEADSVHSSESEALATPTDDEEDTSSPQSVEADELNATAKELISLLSFEVSQFAAQNRSRRC